MSFIYDDTNLLQKLLKLGQQPQQQTEINKQNLTRLVTRLIESYKSQSGTTAPVSPADHLATSPATLAEIRPFNSGFINFANIEHFLESFVSYTNNNSGIANNANVIKENIKLAKLLLQHPSDSIELDDVTNFTAMTSNPIPLLDKLQHIILDTQNIYRQCIIQLSEKKDTRAMNQNMESAKANLNTFNQFRFALNHKR